LNKIKNAKEKPDGIQNANSNSSKASMAEASNTSTYTVTRGAQPTRFAFKNPENYGWNLRKLDLHAVRQMGTCHLWQGIVENDFHCDGPKSFASTQGLLPEKKTEDAH
jgi:hypothetical protein